MFNLAQQEVYARYKHPENAGTLKDAQITVSGANPVCGDELTLTATTDPNGVITALKHTSRACAICTAAADILPEQVIGKTLNEIKRITPQEITERLGIPLSPIRLKCALLPLETLKQAQI